VDEAPRAGRWKRIAAAVRRANRDDRLVKGARKARTILPGDARFGDPLSTAGRKPTSLAGRQLTELTSESPGVMRELGLGALQVWQALSEAQGRGRGELDMAILFTDLVGFSEWALEAGDEATLRLLRDVGEAIEPPLTEHGGHVVKRLGDGLMAVFADAQEAVDGLAEGRARLQQVRADGYEPRIRAGLHLGRPRRLGGDYLGVDVNIAARLMEAASADEILASESALAAVDTERVEAKKRRWFKAKGAPKDLEAYSLRVPH
jgi:adenylate cyclase